MSDREVDGIDRVIIDLLLDDGRRTFSDIGAHVHLSASAVKRRVDRLEAVGIIKGYTARIDYALLGQPLEAFVELRFSGRAKVDEIANVATGLPEVVSLYTIAGDPDALGFIRVRDVSHLKGVIDQLRQRSPVTGTKTLVVLGGSDS